ncbi:hypothetical protein [Pedobacter metabolipauper]|nr:hypothetical protein [Pedobacter metabolipauper]
MSFEKDYWSGEIRQRIRDRGEEDGNVAWSNRLFHKVGNIYFSATERDF